VYDITRKETFDNLESWIKEVEQYCTGGLERIRMILIGNKVDLQIQRAVRPLQFFRLGFKSSRFVSWSVQHSMVFTHEGDTALCRRDAAKAGAVVVWLLLFLFCACVHNHFTEVTGKSAACGEK
jgi:hypothetical protein